MDEARQGVAIIPAYQAERTVGAVVEGALAGFARVWVFDDGSTDGTAAVAREAGAEVLRGGVNRGKSAGLRALLERARSEKIDAVVSLDADGQHPPSEAIRLDRAVADRSALVLGVRSLDRAGAPHANRRGNSIANFWLSGFAGRPLLDSQCGLRRYPVEATLALGVRGERFAFESEIVLRAALRGLPIVELPIEVRYPADRTTHFHVVRDPTRIITSVIGTVIDERGLPWFAREFARIVAASRRRLPPRSPRRGVRGRRRRPWVGGS